MIERLTKDSTYLETLEKQFTEVFTKQNVKNDIENNNFKLTQLGVCNLSPNLS